MFDYYDQKLSAEKLKRAYRIAPPRVQQYLMAEIDHVLERIHPGDRVLELGCGFGRVLGPISQKAAMAVGIDTSLASLIMAREELAAGHSIELVQMDAARLGFRNARFDVVACVQNGISAFHVDQRQLILESVRVIRFGGRVLLSSYSEKFWDHRLEWFHLQAKAGLLGEIDPEKSRAGNIVCRDGFTATTVGPEQFRELTAGLSAQVKVFEVDGSSLFCEISL